MSSSQASRSRSRPAGGALTRIFVIHPHIHHFLFARRYRVQHCNPPPKRAVTRAALFLLSVVASLTKEPCCLFELCRCRTLFAGPGPPHSSTRNPRTTGTMSTGAKRRIMKASRARGVAKRSHADGVAGVSRVYERYADGHEDQL